MLLLERSGVRTCDEGWDDLESEHCDRGGDPTVICPFATSVVYFCSPYC